MAIDIDNILTAENDQIRKLQDIVKKSIEEENLIIQNLLNPPRETLNKGQRVSDKVAAFGGSWAFIISFFAILLVWIIYNTLAPQGDNFDPYPFILMNLILSCIAALQAPVIMMSQNRKEEKDRKRAENDYLINLKAELELRSLHEKIDLVIQEQIKVLYKSQAEQLEILHNIEKKILSQKG
jgi:uncharacterized membrane protein